MSAKKTAKKRTGRPKKAEGEKMGSELKTKIPEVLRSVVEKDAKKRRITPSHILRDLLFEKYGHLLDEE